MKPIWLFLILSGLPFASSANGQFEVDKQGKIIPELLFDRFTSKDGLPDNRIRAIFQDSRGFLWLGTMNGLSKYDGYTFKNYYKTNDAGSISGNWTNSICEDGSGNFWIGTISGLNLFNTREEKFSRFVNIPGNKNSLFSNRITSLQTDKTGKVWIGTEEGLATFDPKKGKFTTLNQYPFNTNICKIIRSYGDFIWIATRQGVAHYNVRTNKYQYYQPKIKPNIYRDVFWTLYEDSRNLYIGTTNNGLLRLNYNPKTGKHDEPEFLNTFFNTGDNLATDEIFDVCKSPSGDFWLATGRGIAKIEALGTTKAKLSFYQNNPVNDKSLSHNRVYKVYIDKNNILWCGTEMGLNKLNLHLLPFHFYAFADPQSQDQVRSIYTRDGDNIWFGTSMNGLYKYNVPGNTTTTYRFKPGQSGFNFNGHRSLYISENNEVWSGTLGGSIKFNALSPSQFTEEISGIGVYAYLRDSRHNLWIGTIDGLFKIRKDGTKVRYLPDPRNPNSLSSRFLRSLYEDHRGNIWVGSEMAGLSRYDPEKDTFTNVNSHSANGKVLGNIIYSILEYPRNVLWAGTESGLNKIEFEEDNKGNYTFKVKNYTEADGLSDKSVNGIVADDKGFLWISTIKGLLRFDTRTEKFQNYLPTLNFSFSSAFKFNDNKFLFGTSDGFIMFDPHHISTNTVAPTVVISDLKLFNQNVEINGTFNDQVILNQSIADTKQIELSYKNNVFTLGFTGLHFSNPEDNFYAYKMEGFDKDWIYTKAPNRSATYTNLDPGTYYFKVRAANSQGIWSSTPAVLKIQILTPPWKTWWAILFYIIVFLGCLYIVMQYLLIQARQRQQIRFDHMEIEQLKKLSNMKMEFFTDISHEFRTPLSLIVGPVEDILSADSISGTVKQKLQLVQRNCNSLLHLIDELMTFQKIDQGMLKLALRKANIIDFIKEIYSNFESYARKASVDLRFNCDINQLNIWFDPGKMEMVLNNLIFNAFKFTGQGGYILVKVYSAVPFDDNKSWLCIAIEDNGKGIHKDEIRYIFDRFYQGESNRKGAGVGLSLSKSLVELHKGMITVESEPNVKTCFTIFFPLINIATETTKDPVKEPLNGSVLFTQQDLIPPDDVTSPNTVSDKPELFIVDDNEEILAFLEMLFKNQYQVRKAQNGIEAIESIRRQEPDLIISDVMMPKMNGIELCRIIKDHLTTCHIPVILLTAKSATEDAIEGIGTGADDYVPKPFNAGFLRIRVEKLIESQKRLTEKFRGNAAHVPGNVLLNPTEDAFLEKITECIKDNINNEEFSVVELGSIVGMSRSNLFRKLKAITGQTPIEFIYFIRLKYSVDLLLERKLNVSEIAYEVGFKNPSSFSKSFRKQFGKSPSAYLNDIVAASKNELH